ncbi:MAG: A/G-specific adenine glycosylase, partial [Anaerolineales bacterium]|nr:A/G-specific adenine glycosylase [Anaerolineales bacterium]
PRLLLNWYHKHGRTLLWRDHPDPYAVWVSEIMLQQTRVETVIPYFEKWMKLFPDVTSLANASEQDVLNAWEGLGYYSRARNLHKAAKITAEKFNGKLPRDLTDLRSLPGIGRYTVGAIASMAFGMDEPTLDGNLRRVFARLFDVSEFADLPTGEKILWQLAAQNLPKGQAGDYNQALMDLGATICIPKNPRCLLCPLMKICESCKNGTQELRPVLKPKKAVPHYVHAAAVIVEQIDNLSHVLLAQRPSKGLLGGMWEFPNGRVEADPAKELTKVLNATYSLKVKKKEALGVLQHAYTHFKVTVHAFRCEPVSIPKNKNLKWVKITDLNDYPMGKVDRQIAKIVNG